MSKFLFGTIISLAAANSFASAFDAAAVDKIVERDTTKIFGAQRESIFTNNSLLRVAIVEFTKNKDIEPESDEGMTYAVGCRIHSCPEKGLVVIDESRRRLQAAALLSFNCRLTAFGESIATNAQSINRHGGGEFCDSSPTLNIYIVRYPDTSLAMKVEPAVLKKIRVWAKSLGYKGEKVEVWQAK